MKQRGMAMLVVLLMVATMAALAVNTQEDWHRTFSRAEGQQFRQQAKWTLLGAEEWVRLQLLDKLPSENVHLGQPWAKNNQHFQLDGTVVAYQLRDNQACFNLNAITPARARHTTNETSPPTRPPLAHRIFQNLLTQQGLSKQRAIALTTALASITPLLESNQLRALPGVERELWQRLKPLVCTHPHARLRVNINTLKGTTGEALLSALTQGHLSLRQARDRLDARPANGWQTTDILTNSVPSGEATTAFAELQSTITLSSDDMELLLWIEEQPYFYQLRSRLTRTEPHFRVIERRYGFTE
jgi:general secretion pathway protein K